MVAGHLQEKRGAFFIVITYKTSDGRKKSKWMTTGLPVKGNRKKAQEMLQIARRNFIPPADLTSRMTGEMLYADYLLRWLDMMKGSVRTTTYASYCDIVQHVIEPYFRKRRITLAGLRAIDIQEFYTEQLKRVKPNSVLRYHANIHKSLKYAVQTDLIPTNPADKIERPKKNVFRGKFYDGEEMNRLFEVVKGTYLEIPVILAAFYGMRRSEAMGLRWDAIDFERNTIEVKHTVTSCRMEGKTVLVESDGTKTRSSNRTLPLVPQFRERLLQLKEEQNQNMKLCGKLYNREFLGYLCVDPMGTLYRPNTVSRAFKAVLAQNGLREIRFHDLRHSCASLLLANGVPMKQIQEWLGHSDFSTTANIYAHLEYNSKINSAEAMLTGLKMNTDEEKADAEIKKVGCA